MPGSNLTSESGRPTIKIRLYHNRSAFRIQRPRCQSLARRATACSKNVGRMISYRLPHGDHTSIIRMRHSRLTNVATAITIFALVCCSCTLAEDGDNYTCINAPSTSPDRGSFIRGRSTYYGGPDVLSKLYDPTRGEGSFGQLTYGSCGKMSLLCHQNIFRKIITR